MEEKASSTPSVQASGGSGSIQSTYEQKWAHAFGISSDTEGYRARYAFLKETLVFKVDAMGNSDPLTVFMGQLERDASSKQQKLPARVLPKIVRRSINADSDEESNDDDDEEVNEVDTSGLTLNQAQDSGGDGSTTTTGAAKPGWEQYFSDETLLYEINTDLD